VLVARGVAALDDVAALVRERGVDAHTIVADLATTSGIDATIAQTEALDVGAFVAAAGFGTAGSFLQADLALEDEMLAVNCRAVLALTLAFGRRFAARGRGGIVLLASLVGWQGVPHAAHYAATKAYVQSLAEGLHVELRPLGIDVLAAAPGPVASGFAARSGMRMGATVTPAEVARGTLAALGRRGSVVPGTLSKILTYSLAPLGRPARSRIMGKIMFGMTAHLAKS